MVHETDLEGSLIEFSHHSDDPKYLILSPHGGQVEPNTDTQAMLLASKLEDASAWGTRGIVNGSYNYAFDRWHIESQNSSVEDFPLYMEEIDSSNYEMAVSFHAMGSEEGIIVGGNLNKTAGESLASYLRNNIPEDINVEFREEKSDRAGSNPNNFVNYSGARFPIHLEQNIGLVSRYPVEIVEVVYDWIQSVK